MITIGHLVRKAARRLELAGVGDARLEADLIWMTACGINRAALYASFNESPNSLDWQEAERLLNRRLRREPVAYLMGTREFYGIGLTVAPGVLIPRQETEAVVEGTLSLVADTPSPLIADVGCGSGAIAIAIATARTDATVYALDISTDAIDLTTLNARALGLANRVRILRSDLLSQLPASVHAICANLPYVRSDEIPFLEPEVRLFEPHEALDGGSDGLDLIRRLLSDAKHFLLPGGAIIMEMDPRQMRSASEAALQLVPNPNIKTLNDLTGRARVLVVQTPP